MEKLEDIHYPVFQREDVWSFKDRALLIDSILMGIDIPKFYLYRIEEEGKDEVNWDCIDGHQRLEAISGYLKGMFQFAGREFSELSIDEKNTILNYKLTICEILQITDEEIRELFIRLQLGVPLNSGEKLNSMKSKLGDFVKNKLKNTTFIMNVNIPSRRYTKEALCAQILNNSKYINTSETRSSKFEDLYLLYKKNSEFDENSETAQKIIKVLDILNDIFGDDARFIRNRASAVSIYLLVEDMVFYDKPVDKKLIHDFYVEFLKALSEENRKDPLEFRNRNVFLMRYQMFIIQGADARTSIFERHEALKRVLDNYEINHKIIFEAIDV